MLSVVAELGRYITVRLDYENGHGGQESTFNSCDLEYIINNARYRACNLGCFTCISIADLYSLSITRLTHGGGSLIFSITLTKLESGNEVTNYVTIDDLQKLFDIRG